MARLTVIFQLSSNDVTFLINRREEIVKHIIKYIENLIDRGALMCINLSVDIEQGKEVR